MTKINGNEQVTLFGASGTSHAAGVVPDPGATAGTTKYLREDATWQVPSTSTLAPVVTSLTTGTSTLALNASGVDVFRVNLTQNVTFSNPTGLVDGQRLDFIIKQNPTAAYSVSFSSIFRTSGSVTMTMGTDTMMRFVYDGSGGLLVATSPAVTVTR